MRDFKFYCRVKNIKENNYESVKEYNLYKEWCVITGDNPNDARVILDFDADNITRCPNCEELELKYEMTEVKGVKICRECLRHI